MNISDTAKRSAFSPAKINLFLHITGRRDDGYHLLQSIFCPITLGDQLTITVQPSPTGQLVIQRSGDLTHIPGEVDLTVRACKAFYTHANLGMAYQVIIQVSKQVPEQAGLGGGSSNAATVLRLLQQHHNYPVSPEQLAAIGLTLGADVPFFLQDNCAFVEGIGERITPIQGISGHLIVYKPLLSCPTPKIFSDPQLTRNSSDVKIAVFDSASRMNSELMACLQAHTQNALQAVVSRNYPEWEHQFGVFSNCVAKFNPQLIRMSGSGSAMFALFASPSQLSNAVAAVADAPELQQGQWFECQLKSG
ncbi:MULTISPECIES: 4-(cytidine 5'-diphospho)-2-C-methyl-D-erythritol kinase [unclassified Limnobacter]|uniref:4-(cytidine 5'-diphospho)-2-C-methyl-D-erythritol kinase n=1 Tax=unclassified Limnobacter TaxID=2630203 RepID=UPI0012F0A5C6|nr:4-(cytidine 5'-diphospho)-2-C-methyl-D-erythritol kinase [Limnobacter sp. 130]VWX32828.1 4-diphosphocytidyl-2-C-methyl-D-erythritol kinase [Limnobacter sp. 130]